MALAAQAVGYYRGFSETTFRAVQISAQLIAPLALTWALAELTGKSLGARFTARLGLGALAVVGAVVLATDPLSSADFSKSWPPASVHYQLIPNWVLEAVAVITAVFAVVARDRGGHPRAAAVPDGGRCSSPWQRWLSPSVATDWLRATLPANTGYPLICLAAAALAWFGALRTGTVRLESLHPAGTPGTRTPAPSSSTTRTPVSSPPTVTTLAASGGTGAQPTAGAGMPTTRAAFGGIRRTLTSAAGSGPEATPAASGATLVTPAPMPPTAPSAVTRITKLARHLRPATVAPLRRDQADAVDRPGRPPPSALAASQGQNGTTAHRPSRTSRPAM